MKLIAAVLLVVGVFVAVFLALNRILSRFELGTVVAIIEAFASSIGLVLLIGGKEKEKEADLIASAMRGEPSTVPARLPRDGGTISLPGRILSRDEPLQTPFVGGSAAFYFYTVGQVAKFRGDQPVRTLPTYVGWGRTACYLRSAMGDLSILRYPAITEGKRALHFNGAVIRDALLEFAKATRFEPAEATTALGWGGQFDESDATLRRDFQLASLPEDLNDCAVDLMSIPLDQLVMMSGKYSAKRNGLTGTIRVTELHAEALNNMRREAMGMKLSAAAIMILFGGFGLIIFLKDLYNRFTA